MCIVVTKRYDPPTSESMTAWKWFVLHEDGNLGFIQYIFPQMENGPMVRLGVPMESDFEPLPLRDLDVAVKREGVEVV